jgi:two-component system CheB/CheR fusion protein
LRPPLGREPSGASHDRGRPARADPGELERRGQELAKGRDALAAEVITRETPARLHQPFERGERSGRAGALVPAHGGDLATRSAGPGRGVELVVTRPLTPDAEVPAPAPAPAHPGGRRVLLVEDNEDAGDMLRELLQLEGHVVALARDGAEGLALARTFRPDVVVSDLGLPGELDGYGLARALRAEAGPGLRLVALSGFAAPDDVVRSREAGFDAHFAKPLELERLRPVLAP